VVATAIPNGDVRAETSPWPLHHNMATSGVLGRAESDDEYEDDFETEEGEPSPSRTKAGDAKPEPLKVVAPSAAAAGGGSHSTAGIADSREIGSRTSRRASSSLGWHNIETGDVEVGDRLGGGGFAVVHSGKYKGDPVAVKLIVRPISASLSGLGLFALLRHA